MELINGPGRPLLGISILVFKMGLTGIAIGYILVEMMVRLISSSIQNLPISAGKFSKRQLMKMITFGGATSIVSLSILIIYFSSSFIVGSMLGVKEVAVYQSTIALPFLILRFAIIPFNNLLPSFIFDYERNKNKILFQKSRQSHLNIILYCLLSMAFICLINRQFVSFWVGEELFAGYKFTALYCVFLFLSVARHNGYIMYQTTGKLKPIVIGHLIEIPLNIGLSIVLTEKLGLAGIAYANILGTLPVTFISQIPFCLFRIATAAEPHPATRHGFIDKFFSGVSKQIKNLD
jgi:O-antigen/teichoic acid export membrane protein